MSNVFLDLPPDDGGGGPRPDGEWPDGWGDPGGGPDPSLSPDEQVLAYLTGQPTSGFAGQPVELAGSWAGEANLLWRVLSRGEDAVLKLFLDAGQVRSRRQYDGQALAAPYGLAPQPLWLDRQPVAVPREVVVYRWVEGEPLDLNDATQAMALAQAIARLHDLPVDELDRFSPHPLNLAYFWSTLHPPLAGLASRLSAADAGAVAATVADLRAAAQRYVDDSLGLWQGALPAPVHGDFAPDNCVLARGEPVLLDWELFGLGDAALEAARFVHDQRTRLAAPARDAWLHSYLGERRGDDTAGLEARITVYRNLLPLQDLTTLLAGALGLAPEERLLPDIVENLPVLAAMVQRTLADAAHSLGDAGSGLLGAGRANDLGGDDRIAAECRALFAPAANPGENQL